MFCTPAQDTTYTVGGGNRSCTVTLPSASVLAVLPRDGALVQGTPEPPGTDLPAARLVRHKQLPEHRAKDRWRSGQGEVAINRLKLRPSLKKCLKKC